MIFKPRHKIEFSSFYFYAFFFALSLSSFSLQAHSVRVQILSKLSFSEAFIEAPGARVNATLENGETTSFTLNEILKIQKNYPLTDLTYQNQKLSVQSANISALPNQKIAIQSRNSTRNFLGEVQVRSRLQSLSWINQVPLEAYVLSVLPEEMSPDNPLEALKAQAILVRTFALNPGKQHKSAGFDVCDLTHCQVYQQSKIPSAIYQKAAESTRGQILTYHGKAARAVYHSTCGGHTSPNQKIFGGKPVAYLQGVDDQNYCQASPSFQWQRPMAVNVFEKLLQEKFDFQGPFQSARVAERDSVGRALAIELVGAQTSQIPTQTFLSKLGKKIGWNQIKSPWFDLEQQGDQILFQGRGLGHGVGMCQWGARGMAKAGKKYKEILAHYFPGTKLGLLSN